MLFFLASYRISVFKMYIIFPCVDADMCPAIVPCYKHMLLLRYITLLRWWFTVSKFCNSQVLKIFCKVVPVRSYVVSSVFLANLQLLHSDEMLIPLCFHFWCTGNRRRTWEWTDVFRKEKKTIKASCKNCVNGKLWVVAKKVVIILLNNWIIFYIFMYSNIVGAVIELFRSEFFADILQRLGANDIIRKVFFAEPL